MNTVPTEGSVGEERIALRNAFIFSTRGAKVSVVALRRPELVLRATRYDGVTVDERLLTKSFPWIAPARRLQVLLVTRGHIDFGAKRFALGDVLLLIPGQQSQMRFVSTSFIELEWTSPLSASHGDVRHLGTISETDVVALQTLVESEPCSQRVAFTTAVSLAASVGAPLAGISPETFTGGPSLRDMRIAKALEEGFSKLRTELDTLHLSESLGLSQRQLQRVLVSFGETHGFGIQSWRDLRNRWRVQMAAVLLSVPTLNVQEIAAEVGFSSAPALARAFASAGLPTPTEIRRRFRAAALHNA